MPKSIEKQGFLNKKNHGAKMQGIKIQRKLQKAFEKTQNLHKKFTPLFAFKKHFSSKGSRKIIKTQSFFHKKSKEKRKKQ